MKNDNWKHWQESGAAYIQSNGVRQMWFDRDPSTASQGQEPCEQLAGERRGSLPAMPQGGSHDGWNVGARQSRRSDLQGVLPNVPTEANAPGFDMQPGVPVGMGPDKCRQALEFTPRVENGVIARVDRLKAIGNGQVPQCAAEAWRLLTANAQVQARPEAVACNDGLDG